MKREKPNAPIWLKILIAFHIVAILSWSLPSAPDGVRSKVIPPIGSDYLLLANEDYVRKFPPLRTYLITTGFWQYWDMFSPNPSSTDTWGDAEIVRQDGSVERYQYPRMYILGIWDKFMLERYRKFYERAHDAGHAYLWPQFAHVIASKVDNDPNNRPVEVRLYRHQQILPKLGEPMPTEYSNDLYTTQRIDPKLLDRIHQP